MRIIRRVFLIERPEDIDDAISRNVNADDHVVFVALRPVVAWELECRGIPFRTILSYGMGRARWEKTLENFAILNEITAIIDAGIANLITVKTIRPAQFSYYYLKILLDVITTKALVLRTIISVEQPDELIGYYCKSTSSESFFPFPEEESVFSFLLELNGWDVSITIIHPNVQNPPPVKNARKLRVTDHVRSRIKWDNSIYSVLYNLAFIQKHFGTEKTLIAIVKSVLPYPTKAVMIYNSGYNWDYSLPSLSSVGINPVYHFFGRNDESPESSRVLDIYTKVLYICNNDESIRRWAVIGGIDTSTLLFNKIASIVSRAAVACEGEYRRSRDFFQKTGARCILISTQASHSDRAVIQAARDLNVNVISWQHGGAGFCYHPFMYHAEFFSSDVHLVFGVGVKESYEKTCKSLGLQKIPLFIAVGSSWLDREHQTMTSAEIISTDNDPILYITEKYQFNLYYNSTTFDSTEICDHFWEAQHGILEFFRNHPGISCIFKLHPSDNQGEPARSYVKKYALENVRFIVKDHLISDLIPSSQAIVIDFVATGILEALLTDKPIFIYMGMYIMDDTPVALLGKRAFLYDSIVSLRIDLERFLRIGSAAFAEEHEVDYHNTEFVQSFGTYLHDGGSSQRAADLLKTFF